MSGELTPVVQASCLRTVELIGRVLKVARVAVTWREHEVAALGDAGFEARAGTRAYTLPLRGEGAVELGRLLVADDTTRVFNELDRELLAHFRDGIERELNAAVREALANDAHAMLRLVRERARLVTEASGHGTWELDLTSGSLHCDARWRELLGLPLAAHTLASFVGALHTQDRERFERQLGEAQRSSAYVFAPFRVGTRGGVRWIHARTRLARGSAEATPRLLGVIADVTDSGDLAPQDPTWHLTQEATRRAEQLARVGSWSWDRATDRMLWSEMVYEIFAWPRLRPPPLRVSLGQLFTAASYVAFERAAGRSETTGMPETIDVQCVRFDGQLFAARVVVETLSDATGVLSGLMGSFLDVSERRAAEERERVLGERVRVALRASNLGIWEQSLPSGRLAWDERMFELYEASPAAFRGVFDDWTAYLHPDDRARVLHKWGLAVAKGRGYEDDFRIVTRAGRTRHLHSFSEYLPALGDIPARMVGSSLDVTSEREALQKLAERDAMQRASFVQAPVFLAILDPRGHLLDANELFFDATGAVSAAEIGRPFWGCSFWPEALRGPLREATALAARGDNTRIDVDFQGVDAVRHADMTLAPVRGSSGRIEAVYVTAIDTTDRHQVEEALRESEEHYRVLTESLPCIVWSVGLDGQVTYVSEGSRGVLGWEPHLLLGEGLDALVHPDDRARYTQRWVEVMAASGDFDCDVRMRTSAGEHRWMMSRAHLVSDEHGQPQRWLGSTWDSDELRRAQAAAETAAKSKSDFLANMSHEIRTPMNAVVAFAGMLIDTELTASQREMVRSMKIGADHLMSVINDILDFSRLMAGDLELERRVFGLRGCIEDCLDLVGAQAAEKDLSLTYTLAPEVCDHVIGDEARLRQVLLNLLANAVKFTAAGQVTVTVETTPESGNGLRFAVTDSGIGIPADRMDRLFRDFSQVDSSTRREFGGTGLGLAISKRLSDLMGGAIGVTSEPDSGSTFWFTIDAEPAPLAQDELPPQSGWVLVVDDSAPDRELLARLLAEWGFAVVALARPNEAIARFWSGERFDLVILDDRMPEMNGIELAAELTRVSRGRQLPPVIISAYALHAQEVRARARTSDVEVRAILSKPLRQSTLRTTLAAVLAPGQVAVAAPTPALTRADLRILLVEDNHINQRVALLLLDKLRCRADVASDGVQAVRMATTHTYDIVLMDIQMAEMDGLEATRTIRAHFDELGQSAPYIVAMTAHALAGDREQCLAAGMQGYLSKPIDLHRLAVELNAVAERERAPRMLAVSEELVDALGESGVVEVIDMFLENAPQVLADVQASVGTDPAKLVRSAHTLKSLVAIFGADELAKACGQIERGENVVGVGWISSELDRLLRDLRRQRESLAARA